MVYIKTQGYGQDTFEDLVLGYLAKARFDRSTAKDYVDGAVLAKKFNVRFE